MIFFSEECFVVFSVAPFSVVGTLKEVVSIPFRSFVEMRLVGRGEKLLSIDMQESEGGPRQMLYLRLVRIQNN